MSKRFYEIEKPDVFAKNCGKPWGAGNKNIGPINTNFPEDIGTGIRLVVVCQSPSKEEIDTGYPSVGRTGARIYHCFREANGINDWPKNFTYIKCYELLAEKGVYVTNLVRCQADFDGNSDVNVKIKRVKEAWNYNRPFLKEELEKIAAVATEAKVLFACGSEFDEQIKDAIADMQECNLPWMVSYHPSRFCKELYWHYNPSCWGEDTYTFPEERMKKRLINKGVFIMSEVYRTYGKISSVSTEKKETLQEIELDFEKNYRAELKIECDSNPQILGVAQLGKEYASPDKHKLIDKKFIISDSLQNIALSAMDKNRLVELEFVIQENKKKEVTKIKVK